MSKDSGHSTLWSITVKELLLSAVMGNLFKKTSYVGSKCSPLLPVVCDIQHIITQPTLEKYIHVISKYLCSVFTWSAIKSLNCCAFTIIAELHLFPVVHELYYEAKILPLGQVHMQLFLLSPSSPAQPLTGSPDQPYLMLLSPCWLGQSQNPWLVSYAGVAL